jgi:hypothetical protein
MADGVRQGAVSRPPCLPCVISVMSVGCVQLLYRRGWKCPKLAAEQPLSGKAVRSIRAVRHSTNHTVITFNILESY